MIVFRYNVSKRQIYRRESRSVAVGGMATNGYGVPSGATKMLLKYTVLIVTFV